MNGSPVHRARELVLEFGWNSTCFQILNPGIELWFSASGNAVVGYVLRKRVRVVAGAPVCSQDALEAVIREWEDAAEAAGHSVCYFGAEARLNGCLIGRPGYSTVSLGAQPSWNPQDWESIFERDRTLRAQRSRAVNKHVVVREWSSAQAINSPELRRCLTEWLTTRGLPPMHFLVEPETLGCLDGRRVFVAEQGGRVVGFLVLSPVPERNGWLTEQFPRALNAPNGTVEILMDYAIRAVAESGAEYVTMGIVPLSLHGLPNPLPNPRWLIALTNWVRAHGRRFYNFDGLDWFKTKFRPQQWEPIYVISKEDRFSMRSLLAIAAAFSDRSPTSAILRGLLRALRQEVQWAVTARRR
ncbi:MAG: DUF2156 domain-containing protein [Fimbriimonas sp.]|nr:DUF2156 domain-containing protein [Fimbriimonas sp.]